MGNFIILHGPQGCGKTRYAERIAKHLGRDKIVDDWNGMIDQKHGKALYIVTDGSKALAVARTLQAFDIVSFTEVAQQINAAIPKTKWFHTSQSQWPDKIGVYCATVSSDQEFYRHWDGSNFHYGDETPGKADQVKGNQWPSRSGLYWCGLAEEPITICT